MLEQKSMKFKSTMNFGFAQKNVKLIEKDSETKKKHLSFLQKKINSIEKQVKRELSKDRLNTNDSS